MLPFGTASAPSGGLLDRIGVLADGSVIAIGGTYRFARRQQRFSFLYAAAQTRRVRRAGYHVRQRRNRQLLFRFRTRAAEHDVFCASG